LTTAPHPPDAVVGLGAVTVITGGATGVPAVQTPLSHESPVVQTLCVLHEVPSGRLGLLHVPVDALHVPAEWHWSRATQTTALLPTQLPAPSHAYVWSHRFVAVQAVPGGKGGLLHAPVAGSHVPVAWHWSVAPQTTGLLPLHAPAWQTYVCKHALFPLQASPVVGVHVPNDPGTLQALHAPHELAVVLQQTPSTHDPDAHCAVDVQATPKVDVTLTANVICDWFPALSVAVQPTIVLPTRKTLPEAGVHSGVMHGAKVGVHGDEVEPKGTLAGVEQST
jgi:hypothetical protein